MIIPDVLSFGFRIRACPRSSIDFGSGPPMVVLMRPGMDPMHLTPAEASGLADALNAAATRAAGPR